jgi:glucosamine--fructose-6-phosphate aminotransferase (isomerizing)
VAQALAPHIDLSNHSVLLKVLGFGADINELEKLDFAADWQQTQTIFEKVERVFFIACGTSYYAALCGKYLIEKLAGVPAECDFASEFRYRDPVLTPSTLVVAISQSGETADTLAALRMAKDRGLRTMSICNVRRSTLDRESDGHLYMNAGLEIGVASTKAFSGTLAVLNVLAIALGRIKKRLSVEAEQKLVRELLATPSHMETVLTHDKFFREAAQRLKAYKGFLYMGRGIHYPVALEGALKLKELAYMHAEGYAAGEMKHGPLALVDKDMAIVTLAPHDELYDKTMSNLEEAKARGGQILAIGTGLDSRLKNLAVHYLSLPEASWCTLPLLEVVPLQLLAYHLATSLGRDVDQPRNLAKSVTVE